MIPYEVTILNCSEIELQKKLDELQKEEWQICGNIAIDPNKTWCNDKSIRIPLRRYKMPLSRVKT